MRAAITGDDVSDGRQEAGERSFFSLPGQEDKFLLPARTGGEVCSPCLATRRSFFSLPGQEEKFLLPAWPGGEVSPPAFMTGCAVVPPLIKARLTVALLRVTGQRSDRTNEPSPPPPATRYRARHKLAWTCGAWARARNKQITIKKS